jgi:hypothetical protein
VCHNAGMTDTTAVVPDDLPEAHEIGTVADPEPFKPTFVTTIYTQDGTMMTVQDQGNGRITLDITPPDAVAVTVPLAERENERLRSAMYQAQN